MASIGPSSQNLLKPGSKSGVFDWDVSETLLGFGLRMTCSLLWTGVGVDAEFHVARAHWRPTRRAHRSRAVTAAGVILSAASGVACRGGDAGR